MFAVDHAATALLIRREYPAAPLIPLLLSVQAMELAWVALNYLGVERTLTDAHVHTVANIHLASMPYSHSIATALAAAVMVWSVTKIRVGGSDVAAALALGLLSHLVLDLVTHARDIALAPGASQMFGMGLYDRAPVVAFVLEILYGVGCWWVYVRGRRARTRWRGLLAFVVVGNLLNAPFLVPGIPGPQMQLAGRPLLVVSLIAMQIAVTLWLVYRLTVDDETVMPFAAGQRPQAERLTGRC